MNSKSLQTLEYNKIINKLADFASSEGAKEMCMNLVPMDNLNMIKEAQTATSDAVSRLWKKGSIAFSGIRGIKASLKRLEIGSTLGTGELLNISSVLKVALRVKNWGRTDDENVTDDSLSYMFNGLEPLSKLNNEIERCILSEEEISDDASPELKSIRRQIKLANDQIHSHLNSMINSSSTRTYLQEYVITMRNGRYCIPVKQEYRNQVPGMVHDQSSTGSTVFIEPMSVVKLNNDIKELMIREQDAIEVILSGLSNQCGENIDAISENLSILTELDFIFAKAKLSKDLNCCEPEFNNQGIINLKDARHPLIDSKKVVPVNIRLGEDFDLLIVTGPNTGGKTVSLKTTGLLTLMGQAGLHIPAYEGSKLAVFNEVYADIGDEQSIEQSLSTFSSHMTNTVNILNSADDSSLVLFDELGAGTDPTEGAALAISILSFLHNMNVRTMATTHYSELKVFALSAPGVENACCEFDVQTLRPTYRLLIGVPGKSNAFAISEKIGLPNFIIEDAKKRIDDNDIAFEDVITDLESSKLIIEKEQQEIENYKKEIEKLKIELEKKHERLDDSRDKILRNANEEAAKILQDAKSFADEQIREINKMAKSGSSKNMEKARGELGKRLNESQSRLTLKSAGKPSKQYSPKDFKIGTLVKVLSMNAKGTVSTIPNSKGELFVQMGILRSQVNIKDLEIIEESDTKPKAYSHTNTGKIKMSKSAGISTEINLIGMTVDEAISHLDKYLDDAYLSHISNVRIVHGKGTGALRKGVHTFLKRCTYVRDYRLASFGEGDSGVTIVEFK
ncbi:MAG: endonuclease MutS2 [Lachnospiraceae bacterium]|nr:endonuclease MutS2 [Lachnospiraceae bacterium]